jgi:hypothetical protein
MIHEQKQTLISRSGPSDGQPHCQTWGTLIGTGTKLQGRRGRNGQNGHHIWIYHIFFLFPLLYMLLVEIDVRVLGTDVMHRILA